MFCVACPTPYAVDNVASGKESKLLDEVLRCIFDKAVLPYQSVSYPREAGIDAGGKQDCPLPWGFCFLTKITGIKLPLTGAMASPLIFIDASEPNEVWAHWPQLLWTAKRIKTTCCKIMFFGERCSFFAAHPRLTRATLRNPLLLPEPMLAQWHALMGMLGLLKAEGKRHAGAKPVFCPYIPCLFLQIRLKPQAQARESIINMCPESWHLLLLQRGWFAGVGWLKMHFAYADLEQHSVFDKCNCWPLGRLRCFTRSAETGTWLTAIIESAGMKKQFWLCYVSAFNRIHRIPHVEYSYNIFI